MTSLIGASIPKPDARGKVTGATRYPADLVRPDMLQLKVVFAHRPHARILHIDTAEALRYPGVVDVLTAADVPYNAYGLVEADQPALCSDKVRYVGCSNFAAWQLCKALWRQEVGNWARMESSSDA